jgi:hypothetical protein
MTESGNKSPIYERALSFFGKALRWAAPPKELERRRGCFHPLSLIRLVVFFVLLAYMPLFLLPTFLGRLMSFGLQTLRQASAMGVTSGEEARWEQALPAPTADLTTVTVGVRAIAAHDPRFDPDALVVWAKAASELICQSLTTGDPDPVRTFMVNGLFRAHRALLELRAGAHISCEGSWRASEARVVQANSTPLVDLVLVRLSCEGWCWERHEPSGLSLRGGPELNGWAEELTFGRSARAHTPPGGGLPARRCPSCGAGLELGPDGTCKFCKSVVTAGSDDWALVEWRRDPW